MDGRQPQALSDSLQQEQIEQPLCACSHEPLQSRLTAAPRRRRRNHDDLLSGVLFVRGRNVVAQTTRGSTVDSTDTTVLAPLAAAIALSRHKCRRGTILIRTVIVIAYHASK
jgi:hypothetical protein